MNKLATIFLSIFYLTLTVGVAVDIHYCHGEMASVEIYGGENVCCCGSDSGNMCCHNQTQVIKYENDPTLVFGSQPNIYTPVTDILNTEEHTLGDDFTNIQLNFQVISDHPPELPAWLRFCSLVYYG